MADSPIENTDENTRGVTAQQLQQRLLRSILAEWVHSAIPARVQRVTVNDDGQTMVDVQVLVKDFHRNESGALVVESVPVICNVPVMFLTAGGFTFTVPIRESTGRGGTTGLLIFAERSLDRWLAGAGQEVDPELYSRFSITDAVFIPGLLPFGAVGGPDAPTDHATAGSIQGVRIHFRDGTICIGDEAGSKKIVLDGDSVNAGTLSGTVLVSGSPVPVQFTYTPAGGAPGAPGPAAALTGGTVASSATQAKGK